MLRYLWNSLRSFLRPESLDNGDIQSTGPTETLIEIHYRLSSLADHLDSHSEKAPYPHVRTALRHMASETRQTANLLKAKIESFGGSIKEPSPHTPVGKNHWERLTRDLQDQKTLESFLTANEPYLGQEMSDVGVLLRQISSSLATQADILAGLIARADPQAEQT